MSVRSAVDHVLANSDDRVVVVGPAVWKPSDGLAAKTWYFIVAGHEPKGFRCDQIVVADQADRNAFVAELAKRHPLVIYDMDDETYMARFCETIWPCPETTKIREKVEAEKAGA